MRDAPCGRGGKGGKNGEIAREKKHQRRRIDTYRRREKGRKTEKEGEEEKV